MRTALLGVILGAGVLLAGCGEERWLDHRGESVSRADLQDRWMVVNYWAEWCAPCRHELPEFNSLAKKPNVAVFGVNYDGISGNELHELADEMDIEFAVMGQDFVDSFGLERPQVLPTTYVFNPDGKLLHSLAGPQTEETLLALLE
ncbi:TlpA disulfide reductase family protein [Halopseudomonas sp. SMJS2]|uniref:TlpA family protein disulfide reductase n=1 Tax=Halopseudomonas sp. SMJS2 TaxID=3041098 RepID=UPI00055B543C|nr:TlpA disulfide reductase family protein [Halopseudomonas sp. SMJS2]WGK60800.1 TlpA disulfide reductase family protein [Halopseudomonas sp. SMJS2]